MISWQGAQFLMPRRNWVLVMMGTHRWFELQYGQLRSPCVYRAFDMRWCKICSARSGGHERRRNNYSPVCGAPPRPFLLPVNVNIPACMALLEPPIRQPRRCRCAAVLPPAADFTQDKTKRSEKGGRMACSPRALRLCLEPNDVFFCNIRWCFRTPTWSAT